MSKNSMSPVRKATLRGKVAVIGIGISPVGKVPGKSPLWLAADATKKCLLDAGIEKREIDGVLSCQPMASPFHRFSIAFSEYFGIRPTFSNTLQVSGATVATMFNIGAAAIHGGLAETVLVVGGDSLLSGLTPELALRSLTESRDQQYEMALSATQVPNNVVIMGDDALTCASIRSSVGHSQMQDMRL